MIDKFKLWKYLRIYMIYNPNYCEQSEVDCQSLHTEKCLEPRHYFKVMSFWGKKSFFGKR